VNERTVLLGNITDATSTNFISSEGTILYNYMFSCLYYPLQSRLY